MTSELTIGQCANLACLLEALAPKPGNVHRGADFEDLSFSDLAISGVVIAPSMTAIAAGASVGAGILSAVHATQNAVGTNSNLGTILLFAPLAAAMSKRPTRGQISAVLANLTPEDAAAVYQAIRLARPGGMGETATADIAGPPPDSLIEAMRLAQDRDLVARQYVNNFEQVFDVVLPLLAAGLKAGWPLFDAIVHAHLNLLAKFPDSLIARKCGAAVAQRAADHAAAILKLGTPQDDSYQMALGDFDFWLRSDGHRRNPGTSADLIAAGLFVALREGLIKPPYRPAMIHAG